MYILPTLEAAVLGLIRKIENLKELSFVPSPGLFFMYDGADYQGFIA